MWSMILYIQLMYPVLWIQNKLRRKGPERGTKEQVLYLIQTRVQVMSLILEVHGLDKWKPEKCKTVMWKWTEYNKVDKSQNYRCLKLQSLNHNCMLLGKIYTFPVFSTIHWGSQNAQQFYEWWVCVPTHIPYPVSAMEMVVGLLLWNTSNATHIEEHLKPYAEVGETSSQKQMFLWDF